MCNNLGVPLAPEKQEGPSTCITFLGIIIDIHRQELRLPREKLERILATLAEWEQRKSRTRRELESLTGILQHACTIIRPGRTFLRNAIPLLKMAKQQHHHIRLSVEIRSDLAWWKLFASYWNGTGLVISPNSATYIVTSDAFGSWDVVPGLKMTGFPCHGNKTMTLCTSNGANNNSSHNLGS